MRKQRSLRLRAYGANRNSLSFCVREIETGLLLPISGKEPAGITADFDFRNGGIILLTCLLDLRHSGQDDLLAVRRDGDHLACEQGCAKLHNVRVLSDNLIRCEIELEGIGGIGV